MSTSRQSCPTRSSGRSRFIYFWFNRHLLVTAVLRFLTSLTLDVGEASGIATEWGIRFQRVRRRIAAVRRYAMHLPTRLAEDDNLDERVMAMATTQPLAWATDTFLLLGGTHNRRPPR